jgi:hypothetical protein
MIDLRDWTLCRDNKSKYYYYVKETRGDDEFELLFSFYPDHPQGYMHGGIKVVARTLDGFINNIYYKKYQSEKIT